MFENKLQKAMIEWIKAKEKAKEATAEKEKARAALEAEMDLQGVDTLVSGKYRATRKDTTTNRVDTQKLKKEFPEVYAACLKAGNRHDFNAEITA